MSTSSSRFVSLPGPAAARTVGEGLAEFLAPPPHRLIRDDNASLGQKALNVSQMHPEGAAASDGWFATRDVATIDVDGHVELVDRSKDVIKSGGEWIRVKTQ
jgi:acyl-CoA synthetase (AMP-forming)/AMP-acid ligase II